jgi:hypothetical protein
MVLLQLDPALLGFLLLLLILVGAVKTNPKPNG